MIRRILYRMRSKRLIKDLENGRFFKIMDSDTAWKWVQYVERQMAIPHTTFIILRVTMDVRSDLWNLWAVYQILDTNKKTIKLDAIMIPAEEKAKLAMPDEIAGREYFAA